MKVKKVSKPALHADTYSVACVVNNNAEVLESVLNRIKELEKRLAQEDATEDKVKQTIEEMKALVDPKNTILEFDEKMGVKTAMNILVRNIREGE